jgi:hypothetical protein
MEKTEPKVDKSKKGIDIYQVKKTIGYKTMNVSELIDALRQYDPSSDVVISSTPYGGYFHFTVKEQKGLALRGGAHSGAVTLEVAEEISQYTLTL